MAFLLCTAVVRSLGWLEDLFRDSTPGRNSLCSAMILTLEIGTHTFLGLRVPLTLSRMLLMPSLTCCTFIKSWKVNGVLTVGLLFSLP